MEYLIGAALSLVVCYSANLVGFDRDRAFYPLVMIVIASYYALFAVMAGSTHALVVEGLMASAFLLLAIAGFKYNLWLLVFALLAHGVFDLVHGHLVWNPGVPAWWPMFCLTYDVAAAGYLGWLLRGARLEARAD
jgi:hypothetical protein